MKFFFHYTDTHLKVLTSEIDDKSELRYKAVVINIDMSQADDDDAHNDHNDDEAVSNRNVYSATQTQSAAVQAFQKNSYPNRSFSNRVRGGQFDNRSFRGGDSNFQ